MATVMASPHPTCELWEHERMMQLMRSHLYLASGLSVSAVLHGVMLASFFDTPPVAEPATPYIEVQLGELSGSHDRDVLSMAKPADEVRVPQELLPQLPEHQLRRHHPRESTDHAGSGDDVDKADAGDAGDAGDVASSRHHQQEQQLAAAAQIKAQALAEMRQKRAVMKHQEFIARLVKERARQERRYAKELTSPPADASELLALNAMQTQGTGTVGGELREFLRQLQRRISSAYELPEVYKYRAQLLVAAVSIQLNQQGHITQLALHQSSGDQLFDAMSLRVVRGSQPLPVPPPSYHGQAIVVHFSPGGAPTDASQ